MAETYSIKWTNHAPETISSLNRLRCMDALSDVVILCRSEVFRAHKLVLSVCSEYFEGMFVSNPVALKEPVIVMHQTPPDLFRMVLDFMYTGEVEIPHGALEPFMELAECLLIRGLRSAYEHNAEDLPQSPLIQVGGGENVTNVGSVTTPAVPPTADSPPASPTPFTPAGADGEVAGAPPTPPTPPENHFLLPKKLDLSAGGRQTMRKRTSKSEETEVSQRQEAKPKRSKRTRVKTEQTEGGPLSGNSMRSGEERSTDGEYESGEVATSKGLDENGEAEAPENGQGNQQNAVQVKAEFAHELPENAEPISSLIYRDTSKTSGGPMYACVVCGYRTVSRSYALTHERIHTGERPFPCRLGCGKFFTQTSSRNLHESKRRRCVPDTSAQETAQCSEAV